MTDNDLKILSITETWLSPLDSPHIAALNTLLLLNSQPSRLSPSLWRQRTTLESSLIISNSSYHSFSHSEALSCPISSPFSRTFNISLFYHPISPNINSFLDEFSLFLLTITSNTIILGDFNIPNPHMINSLNTFLTSFYLVQHVSFRHVHGNTLDLIISPKTNKIITEHSIGPLFSYHFLIFLTLNHPKPTRSLTTRISRKHHSLPIPAFISDISSLPTSTSAELHTYLSSTLDKYAPLCTKTSITRPDSYWYTISLLKQKRILRKAEKSYFKHPSPTSLVYYNNLKHLHRKSISTAKASHVTHKLINSLMTVVNIQTFCPTAGSFT